MKVEVPGYLYWVDYYPADGKPYAGPPQPRPRGPRRFVKKVGPNFPGNELPQWDGTNCQEELRVLIDRVKYLDNQHSCRENKHILDYLRASLVQFEIRAARLKGRTFPACYLLLPVEEIEPCEVCGYIYRCEHDDRRQQDTSAR